jgi:hypothetical protein
VLSGEEDEILECYLYLVTHHLQGNFKKETIERVQNYLPPIWLRAEISRLCLGLKLGVPFFRQRLRCYE